MAERGKGIERAFAWRMLRLLLPGDYRRRFGDDFIRTHAVLRGNAGAVRFWLNVASDVLKTSLQVRWDRVRGDRIEARRVSRAASLMRTVRAAGRDIARAPGFALAVAVTLGLGIGVNTTMYTILDRIFFSPPEQISDASGLRNIYVHGVSPFSQAVEYSGGLAYPDYSDLQRVKGFSGVAGYARQTLTAGRGDNTEKLSAELATASYFAVLGVRPQLGRFFSEEEDRMDSEGTAVLSHEYWRTHFGSARNVVGRTLDIGSRSYRVIGVAPRGFTGIDIRPVDVWLPLHPAGKAQQGTEWVDARSWYWMAAVARVAPGTSDERIEAEATAAYRAGRAATDGADPKATIVLASIIPGLSPEPTREATVTRALGALTILVLLVACANAGNLFLARGLQRRRAYAIQTAIGGSRRALISQLFIESLLISLIAGAFAYGAAALARPLLFRTLLPDAAPPALAEVRVALVTVLFAFAAAVLAGAFTAVRSSRIAPFEVLRTRQHSLRTSLLRRSLVAVQAALAVIMLVGAGLFLRSLQRAAQVDVGMDLDAVGISIELTDGTSYGEEMATPAYAVLQRLRSHPGVESAAMTALLPFQGLWGLGVRIAGPDTLKAGPNGPFYMSAGGGYFDALGIRILEGRALTEADDESAARVAVVTKELAKAAWPGRSAIGQCLFVKDRPDSPTACTTVVGVANDYIPDIESGQARQMYYLPPRHPDTDGMGARAIVARLKPDAKAGDIVAAARTAAPNIRFAEVSTLRDFVAPQLRAWSLGASLLTAFGVIALLVAAAGLYSVLAFEVAQRRFELGLRSALGASTRRIVTSLLGSVVRATIFGVLCGIAASLALGRIAASMLFQIQPADPLVYAGVLVMLALFGGLAAAVPAWRALRVSPRVALAEE